MYDLEPAELRVLARAARLGESARETAAAVGWPPHIVQALRKSACRKLGARNVAHAVSLTQELIAEVAI